MVDPQLDTAVGYPSGFAFIEQHIRLNSLRWRASHLPLMYSEC